MLTGSAALRLVHVARSVPTTTATQAWFQEVDDAHTSSWLHCLSSSATLGEHLGLGGRLQLRDVLDLPHQMGGAGLPSLELCADEELLGSWATVTSSLSTFLRSVNIPVYSDLADMLADLALPSTPPMEPLPTVLPSVQAVREVHERM